MVPARRKESTVITIAATRKTRKRPMRSFQISASMSPPWVDSRSTPRTVRKRWIGTPTETMVSPARFSATELEIAPESAVVTSRPTLPGVPASSSVPRTSGLTSQPVRTVHSRARKCGFASRGGGRSRVQDAAQPDERARVEKKRAVAVIDPGARVELRDDAAQQGRHLLGIDGELQGGGVILLAVGALARMKLQELVGVERDRVVLDRRRGRDGPGDDVALGAQRLRLRVDEAGAQLVEIHEAEQHDGKAGQVQEHDAAREADDMRRAVPVARRERRARKRQSGPCLAWLCLEVAEIGSVAAVMGGRRGSRRRSAGLAIELRRAG